METYSRMFSGRLGRWQYFLLTMIGTFALLPLYIYLVGGLDAFKAGTAEPTFMSSISMAVIGALTLWHLEVRRLHDMGLSGWLVVPILAVGYLPLTGVILSLIIELALLFWPGKSDTNAYGSPAPSDRSLFDAFLNR